MLNRTLLYCYAIIGIAVSMYLTFTKLTSSPIRCGLGSCQVVQNSPYSTLFGIPVALFGVVFYLSTFILTFYKQEGLLKVWALLGVGFSAYFTFIEAFVIHAYCQWCLISAALTVLIFVSAFWQSLKLHK